MEATEEKIPKEIKVNSQKYIFIKKYSNYYLYKNKKYGYNTCFNKHDLGLIKEIPELIHRKSFHTKFVY